MPIAPIRDLGSAGVLADVDTLASPPQVFNFATNVRFEDNRITRGPVFATSGTIALNSSPRFAFSYKQLSGNNQYHIANRDGTITNWSSSGLGGASTEAYINPVSWTPANYDLPHTSASVQDVVYINRSDRVPWFKPKSSALFAPLPNVAGKGWDPSWRCAAIREVGGVVVALNVTKSGVSYPTMVKTSDFPAFGAAPAEWVGSTTNSATEQIIADLAEPLVDGLPLRDKLILYTENECWAMEPRYDTLMFNYRRLFTQDTSSGIINQNCVAEYNNVHYVFGTTDIWQHDGFNRKSLAAGKNRDFIYNSMDKKQANLFFTQHNPRLNEVMFCYVSNDPYCRFPPLANAGCNRAAVFNYRSGLWYYYDLPYLVGGALGIPFTGITYAGLGSTTYDDLLGSYASFADDSKLSLLMVGTAQTGTYGTLACAVRTFDRIESSSGNGILDRVASAPITLLNEGIDTDVIESVHLRAYKVIRAIYPVARFLSDPGTLYFSFRTKDLPAGPSGAWSVPQAFSSTGDYKLDFVEPGRFLDMQITCSDFVPFSLTGFDVDYVITGNR